MEFYEILKHRKSVRAYEQRPVPGDALDRILATVRYAPSAGFTQGNEYLVLDSPEALADFWTLTDDPKDPIPDEMRSTLPPVLILPLSNRRAYLDRYSQPDKADFGLEDADNWPVPYWDIDAGMASMLMLLAAIDEGLAAWFFGISSGEKALLERFGVPEVFKPIGVIALGYPAATDPLALTASSARRRRRPTSATANGPSWSRCCRQPSRADVHARWMCGGCSMGSAMCCAAAVQDSVADAPTGVRPWSRGLRSMPKSMPKSMPMSAAGA